MRKWVIFFLLFFAVSAVYLDAQTRTWTEDYEKALALAKDSDKYLLIDFSGSDWCPWCIKLDKEVFSKPAFKKYAKDNLVLLLVDFPRKKSQSEELRQQNQGLSEKYNIQGFPTVILLSPDGKLAGETGYQPGGATKYVKYIQEMIEDYEAGEK